MNTWEIMALVFTGIVFMAFVRHVSNKMQRRTQIARLFDNEHNLNHRIFMYNEAEARGEFNDWKRDNRDVCPTYPCVSWDELVKDKISVNQEQWEFMKNEMFSK